MKRARLLRANIKARCSTLLWRAACCSLIWWALSGGAGKSWYVGGVVVALATGISMRTLPPVTVSIIGLLRFAPFFLWRSLKGAIDVARCALDPRLPLAPALHEYAFRLPPGIARVFMANTVTLLPGTLSVEVGEAHLLVHVLDATGAFEAELETLERRVAALFAQPLGDHRRPASV